MTGFARGLTARLSGRAPEHGLAERGRGGWRRGGAALDEVATSTGAADLQRGA